MDPLQGHEESNECPPRRRFRNQIYESYRRNQEGLPMDAKEATRLTEWAVSQHNKKKDDNLRLVSVEKVDSQEIWNTKHDITLFAAKPTKISSGKDRLDSSREYKAVIFMRSANLVKKEEKRLDQFYLVPKPPLHPLKEEKKVQQGSLVALPPFHFHFPPFSSTSSFSGDDKTSLPPPPLIQQALNTHKCHKRRRPALCRLLHLKFPLSKRLIVERHTTMLLPPPSKKRKRTPPLPPIPEKILTSVFLLLPMKSIGQLRCVCKSWLSLLTRPDFIKQHLDHTKADGSPKRLILFPDLTVEGRFEVDVHSHEIGSSEAHALLTWTIPQPPESIRDEHGKIKSLLSFNLRVFRDDAGDKQMSIPLRIQHCDGLILISVLDNIYVSNPITRENKTLPKLRGHTFNYMTTPEVGMRVCLGYDPYSGGGAYKVVRWCYRPFSRMGCEVFTLTGDDASDLWKPVPQDLPYKVLDDSSPVFYNGVVFWEVMDGSSEAFLLALRLKDEKFEVIPTPPGYSLEDENMGLMVSEIAGTICLAISSRDWPHEPDIWFLEGGEGGDHHNHMWEWKFQYRINGGFWFSAPVGALDRKKILLKAREAVYSYDPGTETAEEVLLVASRRFGSYMPDVVIGSFHTSLFVESLVKLGSRKTTQLD